MNTINELYSNYDQASLNEVRNLEGFEHKLVKHGGAYIFNL